METQVYQRQHDGKFCLAVKMYPPYMEPEELDRMVKRRAELPPHLQPNFIQRIWVTVSIHRHPIAANNAAKQWRKS